MLCRISARIVALDPTRPVRDLGPTTLRTRSEAHWTDDTTMVGVRSGRPSRCDGVHPTTSVECPCGECRTTVDHDRAGDVDHVRDNFVDLHDDIEHQHHDIEHQHHDDDHDARATDHDRGNRSGQ